jgi:broad specificity phosphatase PhoE
MRHGEPDVPKLADIRIKSREFAQCMEIYNNSGISGASKPEDTAIDKFNSFNAVVSSDLKRSIDSALRLCPEQALIIDPLFREIEGTYLRIPFFKFAPKTWGNIFILIWLLGLFEFKGSFKAGKVRARLCAEKLIALAETHGRVLFVGHGFVNTYIVKELISLGWDGPKMPNKRYWGYEVYRVDAQ